ncbi:guanylate kinase-related [Holotrichia oblita]|nr:guanylate kinase-related [Holotrichia oblita]
MNKGLLLVICGPSGAGKGTIYNMVLGKMPEIKRSISVTTRNPRAGEKEGIDYYFRTIKQYQQMIAADEFLETASVFNNFYGTPKAPVMEILQKGDDVMFEIDVVGARQIKAKYSDSILIFIMTPNFKTLENRLRSRGTETDESLKTRLNGAYNELLQYPMFDYMVLNDKAEDAASTIESIIKAERQKVSRNTQVIEKILKEGER